MAPGPCPAATPRLRASESLVTLPLLAVASGSVKTRPEMPEATPPGPPAGQRLTTAAPVPSTVASTMVVPATSRLVTAASR